MRSITNNTPRSHGSQFGGTVLDMICNTRAISVALPLGVPCQAHWLGDVDLGPWKSHQGSLINLITEGLALDTAGLAAAK